MIGGIKLPLHAAAGQAVHDHGAATARPRALPLGATGKSAQILHLAPGRDGGSDAGLRAHPRGHHGHAGGIYLLCRLSMVFVLAPAAR